MNFNSSYKYLILAVLVVAAFACDEALSDIGMTQLPERDRVAVGVDTLELSARTVLMNDVFARVRRPVLGEYTDPVFGSIKSEFMGSFFLSHNAGFTEGAILDSVQVVLLYNTFMGDSLAPMRLSVYRLNRSITGLEATTGINPQDYADMSAPIGEEIFTGRNRIFRDEEIFLGGTFRTVRTYEIPVTLPIEIGERFLAEYRRPGHGMMANPDLFNEFFPGLYFTTTFGSSTLISVASTSLLVHYHYLDERGSSTQQDTIRTSFLRISITPEVTQINTVQTVSDHLLEPSDEFTFIKSPVGVKTEITIPVSQIHERLQQQALNLADFTVFAMPDAMEKITVRLNPPRHLLLINREDLPGFFERRQLPDNRTSFLSAPFDETTFSYRFSDISAMINHYMQQIDGPFDLVYYLIPVETIMTTTGGGNILMPPQQMLSAIQNQMWPAATVLDKRRGSMRISMVYSDF